MNAPTIPGLSRTGTAADAQPEQSPSASARPPVDVVIVGDDIHASYAVWAVLRWRSGIRVIGAVTPSDEARALIAQARPHLCLVSTELGWDFIHDLTLLPDAPPVLAYANRRGLELHPGASSSGAAGVVWRYADPDELASTIQAIAGGRQQRHEVAGDQVDNYQGGAS